MNFITFSRKDVKPFSKGAFFRIFFTNFIITFIETKQIINVTITGTAIDIKCGMSKPKLVFKYSTMFIPPFIQTNNNIFQDENKVSNCKIHKNN
jgi:hypothetical protein